MSETIEQMLIRHEGIKLKPYKDTVGKLTIGVGRNLDDVGITEPEALYLLRCDINRLREQVFVTFTWWTRLNEVRQNVVLNMVFNLGLPRFLGFKKMIAAIEINDWDKASEEMLDSKWAVQVKGRATELSNMMKTGEA